MTKLPPSGTLSSFGLTPSKVTQIALPNDLAEWPSGALDTCTALQEITVYGSESQTGSITLTFSHNLRALTQLTAVQLPSTVTNLEGCGWQGEDNTPTIFCQNLRSIVFPSSFQSIGSCAFNACKQLNNVQFMCCKQLDKLGQCAFYFCQKLVDIDLSNCTSLSKIGGSAFIYSDLQVAILPPSINSIEHNAFNRLRTLIWKGRDTRLLSTVNDYYPDVGISSQAFLGASIDERISSGELTEIFIP